MEGLEKLGEVQKKKYRSKYAELTEEEVKKKYQETTKAWRAKISKERAYNYVHGHCDVCEGDYANIYAHNKTKKHEKNLIRSHKVKEEDE